MKRLLFLILTAACLCAVAQNTVSLSGGSGHPGDTVTVTLSLTNSDAVTALQAYIDLGDNLTFVPGSAALTNRSNGHLLTAAVVDGTLQLYSYSLSLATYSGNSGALITFRVVLGQEPGVVGLTPSQTVLSSTTGSSLGVNTSQGSVNVLAPKVQATPSSLDFGHIPIRSSYTRSVTLKNTGTEPLTFTGVTFSDSALTCPLPTTLSAGASQTVTLTYSPVLAGNTTMTVTFHTDAVVGDSVVCITADPYSVNELRPLSVNGYTDSIVTVQLRMNNMDSIVGLQTSLVLPTALTYVDGSFMVAADRAADHTATAGLQGDTLVLLLTSLSNRPLHGADGVVASFQLLLHGYGSHTLQLLGTALSDSTGTNVLSAVYAGTMSIYSPNLVCNSSLDLGNTPATDTAVAALPLFNSGNAPLVVDHIVLTQDGWQVTNDLPLTIGTYGRDTIRINYSSTTEGLHSATLLLYSNDPHNEMVSIQLTAARYEPNALYLEGKADATAALPEVDIVLDNYSAITALQLDVQYPHHNFDLDPEDISLSARAADHTISAARVDDSTLRVLILSMQNTPFAGHSGAVARLQLHAADSMDVESYPIALSGVTSGCIDGVDRLTSVQSVGWFATRLVHDTAYIHDTSYVDVLVHDTAYIHDTSYVDVLVHDTAYIHDTSYVDVTVHDTAYIHDTSYVELTVHDTAYIHDTSYVNVTVHDTAYIHDTSYVNVTVHDTAYITLHDTVVQTQYLYDTIYQIEYLHDTVYVHDTIVVGVDDVDAIDVKIYSSGGQIVVEGAQQHRVRVYDAVGRLLATKQDGLAQLRFDAPATGVYLIKVGDKPARRVVLAR